MTKYFFIFSFVFSALWANAQSNFKPGYYIRPNGDTVKGFIDQRERFNNPKVFSFKTTLSSSAKDISVNDAKAVGVTGYTYFDKFTTSITQGYTSLNRLGNAIDSSTVTATVFLRVIKKGKNVSLYGYTDNIKTRYYVLERAVDKPVELQYLAYFNDSLHRVINLYNYRSQLLNIAEKYQPANTNLINRISNADYDESGFLKIVQLINGGDINAKSETQNLSTSRFFIGAGVKNSTLTFTGANFVFPNGGSKTIVSPTLSGGIDIVFNKETQKLIFRAEFSLADYKYNIDNINTTGFSVDPASSSLDFTQPTVTLHPQLIYNLFSDKAFKLFLNAGFAINFSGYSDYGYTTTTTFSNGAVSVTKKDKYPQFQSTWFSVPIKAGVVLTNSIELYAAYYTSATLTTYTQSAASVTAYQVGLNYLFGRK